MTTSSLYFPSDIIFQILSRTTTLSALDTCKTVSKQWRTIIHEPTFLPEYCRNTENISGYFLQDTKVCEYASAFVSLDSESPSHKSLNIVIPHDTKILASSNHGILCCVRMGKKRNDRYYVCKPVTRQWKALPNPKLRYFTTAVSILVLGSNPLYYKIIRISEGGITKCSPISRAYVCEVFDSKSWRWKKVQDLYIPYDEFIVEESVSIGSTVNWLTTEGNILSFDGSRDCFMGRSRVADEMMKKDAKLIEYEGKLGVVSRSEENITELWLMKNNSRKWEKEFEMKIGDVQNGVMSPRVEGFYNCGIGFLLGVSTGLFYKIDDGSSVSVQKLGLMAPRQVFQFRSDSELF